MLRCSGQHVFASGAAWRLQLLPGVVPAQQAGRPWRCCGGGGGGRVLFSTYFSVA